MTTAAEVGGNMAGGGFMSKLGLASTSVKGATISGAVSGFGAGDIRDNGGQDLVESTVLGGAIGGFSQKLINKYLPNDLQKHVQSRLENPALAEDQAHVVLNTLEIQSRTNGKVSTIGNQVFDELGYRGVDINDWAHSIKSDIDGNFIFQEGDDMLDVSLRSKELTSAWGDAIHKTTVDANAAGLQIPGFVGVNKSPLFAELQTIQTAVSPKITDGQKLELNTLLKKHFGDGTSPTADFTELQVLNRELQHLMGEFSKDNSNLGKLTLESKKIVKRAITDNMDKVDPEGNISKAYNLANDKWADYTLLNKVLTAPARSAQLESVNTVMGTVRAALKRGTQAAALGSKVGVAGAVSDGLYAVFKGETAGLGAKQLKSLNKIAMALEASPGKYQDVAARLISSLSKQPEFFSHELGYAESVIDLDSAPIKRNSYDLVLKAPQVLNILRKESPEMHSRLLNAMQSGNEAAVGEIMSQIASTPQGARFIEGGIGWNGVVATAQDHEKVKSQITNSPQNNRVKARQLMELDRSGAIPTMENPREFMRQTIMARRKNNKKVADY